MKKNLFHIAGNCAAVIILLFVFGNAAQAQEMPEEESNNLAIKAAVVNDSIRLRWAPANTAAWLAGKKYGYKLERFTAYKDSVFQSEPEITVYKETFLPQPLEKWEKQVLNSDYTAVIAQAFYGEDFSVYSQESSMGDIINQSKELDQRFATSVFMAEYDYQGALLAGWAYTDSQVKPNEQYLYRIHINRPVPEPGDTAIFLTGANSGKELPKPLELNATWGDKAVMLSWNYFYLADTYHSYLVERAKETDRIFTSRTDIPITPLNANMQEMFHTDSLPDNDTRYIYRIRGLTSFEQTGPWSDEITGQGKYPVSCIPNIVYGEFLSAENARIDWEFDCNQLDSIARLAIKCSTTIDGEYTIIEDNISPKTNSAVFKLKEIVSYLKVCSYTKSGLQSESFPYLMRQVDSIPPAIPVGLKAEIDTLGIARLSWTPNTEPDLRGYRVLRSFLEEEEKASITPQFITTAEFTDTLSLTNLNRYVYYSVSAIDTYYNESKPCPHIKVEKPNLLPPPEPVITSFIQNENRISLTWATSKDSTITYSVFRIRENNNTPATVFEKNNGADSYTDELTESGTYKYTVIATSKYGKNTYSAQRPIADVTVKEILEPIQGLTYYRSERNNYIELSWRKHPKAHTYILYKKEGDKPMSMLKELDATQNKYVDEWISPGEEYTYLILYRTNTGKSSQTNSITINF